MRCITDFLILFAVCLLTTSCEIIEFTKGNSHENSSGNNNSTHYSLSISPTKVNLSASAGSFSISVKSNQTWTASINNSGSDPIPGLRLSNYYGYGNGAITVSYDRAKTDYYAQIATIIVVGSDNGTEICTCSRYRYP